MTRVTLACAIGLVPSLALASSPALASPPTDDAARTPFSMAVRSGASIPAGSIDERSTMNDFVAWQVPVFVDVGVRPIPQLFLGTYVGVGFGAVSDEFERTLCAPRDCSAQSGHLGVEAQYQFSTADRSKPWIGYGIGFESLSSTGFSESSLRGPEYARFMAGIDFLLWPEIAAGPFIDGTLGRYTSFNAEQRVLGASSASTTALEGEVASPGLHSWLTLGMRLVISP
jgi:hypothetical protein